MKKVYECDWYRFDDIGSRSCSVKARQKGILPSRRNEYLYVCVYGNDLVDEGCVITLSFKFVKGLR
jgi:hypothetical protein